jgi:carboxynorspermidine decarboxylase
VKNNTFNGIDLPSIAVLEANQEVKIVRRFGYQDFRSRLS